MHDTWTPATGAAQLTRVRNSATMSGPTNTLEASCPESAVAASGGASVVSDTNTAFVNESYATDNGAGWTMSAISSGGGVYTMNVDAVCAVGTFTEGAFRA